jgi:hypothetical protein
MRNRKNYYSILLLVIAIMIVYGCEQVDKVKKATSEKIDNADIQKEIENIYKRVKSTDEIVPDNAIEWAEQDIKKIGDWDYIVAKLKSKNTNEIEDILNEYGRSRWECFWMEINSNTTTLYMKRPARSYLKHLPLKELMKAIPIDQGQ